MAGPVPSMTCGGCGKLMAWKPEYVGKRLRCKCGFTMIGAPPAPAKAAVAVSKPRPATAARAAAPQSPPPPPPPAQDTSDDPFESLVAQAEEYALSEEAAKPSKQSKPAARQQTGAAGGAAVLVPASPVLAYARAVPRKMDDGSRDAMLKDIYIPLGLIVAGVLGRFTDASVHGLHNPLVMTVFVMITCTINLVLIFTALLIAVKLLDLGLGNIGPAMLKICAVALLPAAIGDMIRYYAFGFVAWGATLLMYYVLLYYLFELDGHEMRIVVAIIWLMQTWVSFIILALLFGAMGIGLRASPRGGLPLHGFQSGPARSLVANNGSAGDENAAPLDPDQTAAKEISDGTAVEFLKWIQPDTHTVMRGSRQTVLDQADKFYAAGAKRVWAMKIENRNSLEICHEMVIELPDTPINRRAVRKAVYGFDLPETAGDPDAGKRFIHLPID